MDSLITNRDHHLFLGTPRGKNHPINNRGGGRSGPQLHPNRVVGPFQREEGGIEQGDINNPRKRMRDT